MADHDGTGAEVSVVIPTKDRETRLAFALEALAGQTLDPRRFEVIVVRHPDSSPGFAEAPPGLEVRFVTAGGAPGPTGQRNAGWRLASAPLIAFTDDDCRPAEDWLERLVETARTNPGDVVLQGTTIPDEDETQLLHGLARTRRVAPGSGFYEACNVAYPRELLDRLGGFDEDFVFGGEDTDLGLRALKAGARLVPAHDAVTRHAVVPVLPHRALLQRDARNSEPLLVARHPEHRSKLYAGVFIRDYHAHALLGLAGLAAAAVGLGGRRAPWLLAWTPWVANRLKWRLGPRVVARQSLHLPLRAAVESAELLATVRSAIRHRVLAL